MKRNRFAEILPLIPMLLLGAAVRLLGLGNQDLWGDEAFSVMTALGSVRALLTSLSGGEPHPPLYPLLLAGWIRAFGHSELVVRLPSAYAGIASIAIAAAFARSFSDEQRRSGVLLGPAIAGVLVALNPFQVWYSQEARMYAQVSLFAGVAALALLRLWQGRRGAIPLYAIALTATMGSHYFGLFIPLAHAAAVGVDAFTDRSAARPRVIRWAKACGLSAAMYLPWVIYAQQVFRGYYGAQPGTVDLFAIAASAWVRIAAGWSISWQLAVMAAAGLTVLAALGLFLPIRSDRDRFARILLGCWLLGPYLTGFFVSILRPMYAERYLIISSLPFILLIARSTEYLIATPAVSSSRGSAGSIGTRRLARVLGGVGLLAAIFLALGSLYNVWVGRYLKSTYHTHVRDVAALIRPGDAVILDGTSQLPLYSYYLPAPWPTYPLPRQLPLNPAIVTDELARIADHHTGAWIFLYATTDYDPGYLIPRWLTANAYRTFDDWAVSGRLQYYRFAPDSSLTHRETAVQFGDLLSLTSYAWDNAPLAAGDTVPIALTWQAQGTPADRLRVALRLVDGEGFTWAQSDQYIGGDFEPAFPAPVGQGFTDRHGLQVPLGTPPGDYQLRMSVYEIGAPRTLDAAGHGVEFAPGGVNLATVSVAHPSKGFWAAGLAGFHPLNTEFDEGLTLLGFAGSDQATTGTSGFLTLIWKASKPHPMGDKLRVELLSNAGASAQSRDLSLAPATFPPSQWEEGDVIRTQYRLPINQRLMPGTYQIRIRPAGDSEGGSAATSGLILGKILVLPGPTPVPAPRPAQALAYRFGGAINLIGYDLPNTARKPGEPLGLTLYWQDEAPLDRDYTVFVHLLDGAQKVIVQQDQQPAAGQRPTSSWFPGDVVVDHYQLDLPGELATGDYPLEIGLYDATSGSRLDVARDGQPQGDRVILGQIVVGQ